VVRPIRRQGIEHIAHRQDARFLRDLFTFQTIRIAAGVPPFVLVADERRQVPQSLVDFQEIVSQVPG
jgi:hypothetical protein